MPHIKLTDLAIQKLPYGKGQITYWCREMKGFGVRVGTRSKTFIRIDSDGIRHKLGVYPLCILADARRRALTARHAGSAPPTPTTTLAAHFEAFEQLHLPKLAPRTAQEWTRLLRRITHLPNPSQREIIQILETLRPSESNHTTVALNRLYSWLFDTGRIKESLKFKKLHKEKSRTRVLTDDEIRRIWAASKKMSKYGALVRLLLMTGQRKSEIEHIAKAERTNVIAWPTSKNGHPHTIPMLFPYRAEITIILNEKPLNNYDRLLKRLQGLSGTSDWTLHDLRRTAASSLASISTAPHLIERILNHTAKGVAATYNRYQYQTEMRDALTKYHAHLMKVIEKPESGG